MNNRGQQPRGGVRDGDDLNYEAIIDDGNPDEIVRAAQAISTRIKEVKSSQIRGIFATVRQIQLGWNERTAVQSYRSAVLLKPRIAYTAARNEYFGLDDVLIKALDRVSVTDAGERQKRYNNFVDFFEAIVAYHKANGGRG